MSAVRYPVVELRQYTLRPGQRDVLIDLFDQEFVESQEAAGMTIVGQFRDLDDPDRFVWIRGFASMPSRARALASFYRPFDQAFADFFNRRARPVLNEAGAAPLACLQTEHAEIPAALRRRPARVAVSTIIDGSAIVCPVRNRLRRQLHRAVRP